MEMCTFSFFLLFTSVVFKYISFDFSNCCYLNLILLRSGRSGEHEVEKIVTHFKNWLAEPKNERSSESFLGLDCFPGNGFTPFSEICNPNQVTFFGKNAHFSYFTVTFLSSSI